MKKNLLLLVLAMLISGLGFAQLTGTQTIPGDYASIALAITSLNSQGVGTGGVTFNITADYTETLTSPTAGYITTLTGSSTNPIVFQRSGSGGNPIITAGTGTSTTIDAIIAIGAIMSPSMVSTCRIMRRMLLQPQKWNGGLLF